MLSNWSLIINVLLLIGVIVAIGRLMNARKRNLSPEHYKPTLSQEHKNPLDAQTFNDDIIAVRKVSTDPVLFADEEHELETFSFKKTSSKDAAPQIMSQFDDEPRVDNRVPQTRAPVAETGTDQISLMMFLVAKEKRQFAGYELLQTVLAAGLRFGEGNLFYRHQFPNGQGPVLCGLAAATPAGVFDLQNIGAFSVRGLCLFMHASRNPVIDADRFSIMLDTARQLSEGLDATLLDDQQKPLTEVSLARYYKLLNIEQAELEYELTS